MDEVEVIIFHLLEQIRVEIRLLRIEGEEGLKRVNSQLEDIKKEINKIKI
jgi:hypothetical protein